jgi:LDH2 family malate/lactate/ureidoglycolate dehydrogenase
VDESEARTRLAALGFGPADVEALVAHFAAAERTGRVGHGFRRVEWLETWTSLEAAAQPRRVVSEPGYERWDGDGALGYLVLHAIVEAQLAEPPARARLVVAGRTFPTGMLGYWARRLAGGGLVAALTATSPPRLGPPRSDPPRSNPPGGGPKLAGTNPLALAIPSSDGRPLVADVSMGNATYGDVLAGRLAEDDLAPFGGEHAHKAFALAVGLQLLVDALTPDDGFGAVLLVAHPEADPVPALREAAEGVRLPGDGGD